MSPYCVTLTLAQGSVGEEIVVLTASIIRTARTARPPMRLETLESMEDVVDYLNVDRDWIWVIPQGEPLDWNHAIGVRATMVMNIEATALIRDAEETEKGGDQDGGN